MKTVILFMCVGLSAIAVTAQEYKLPKNVFGMLPISDDNLEYMEQGEVSIADWYLMLEEMDDKDLAISLLPKGVHEGHAYIIDIMKYNLDESIFENQHTKYAVGGGIGLEVTMEHFEKIGKNGDQLFSIPVTGVSYEDVVEYYIPYMEGVINSTKKMAKSDFTIELSLPSEELWTEVAIENVILMDPEKGGTVPDSVNSKGCALYDYKTTVVCEGTEGKLKYYGYTDGPVMTYSYNPTKNGFYGLYGNVQEMVKEKGKCKGGSYNMYAKDCYPQKTYTYTEPNAELGFRLYGKLVK